MIITVNDLSAVDYCRKGGREFFKKHDLDWSDFLKNGLEHDVFVATGDAMAIRMVEEAMKNKGAD